MAFSLPAVCARVCDAGVTEVRQVAAGRWAQCRAAPGADTRDAARRPARRAGSRDVPATLPAVAKQPVELHVISDSTGETAVRLVHALEAQFPDQEFEEIRHPRVETVDDLNLALNRAKGRPAVIVYTLVHPELRDAARALCRRYRLHYCDVLGQPIDAVARVAGRGGEKKPGAPPARA